MHLDCYSHLKFVASNSTEKPVAEFLNNLFEYAFESGVSDLHFRVSDSQEETDDKSSLVELRLNGDVWVYERFSTQFGLVIKDMICKKTRIAQSDSHLAHDGRMKLYYKRKVDFRVSIIPLTDRGFSIVCRILDSNNSKLSIDDFNIDPIKKHVLKEAVSKTEGMILVSGPTGSGKTTTLYTLLNYAYTGKNIVITIEDPVEYLVSSYYQIDVNPSLPFAKALSSVLRQDPDIIMLGEIRDGASADTAIKAAATGHMLMSTIHALDTISSIDRLAGMDVQADQIAGVISAVLAQRLVRKIDDDAVIAWEKPTEVEAEWLKRNGTYYEGIKFPTADPSMMTGRIPLMELIEITSEIRAVIARKGDKNELLSLVAKQPQFESLAQCGVKLALAGRTTLSEVIRVTRDNVSLPVKKRFEQVLIERRWLSVDDLNHAWTIMIENKEKGRLYSLEQIIIDHNFSTKEYVDAAKCICESEQNQFGKAPYPALVVSPRVDSSELVAC